MESTEPRVHFSASLSNPRILLAVLRCLSFAQRTTVRVTENGIRFTVEDSRVLEAHGWLHKEVFQTWEFAAPLPPTADTDADEEEDLEPSIDFSISLTALLEALQILSSTLEPENRGRMGSVAPSGGGVTSSLGKGGPAAMFDHQVLRMAEGETMGAGKCKLAFEEGGEGLILVMEDPSVTTTCYLTSYEVEFDPVLSIDQTQLYYRLVMKVGALHDAILELDGSSPTNLVISVSNEKPYFSLSGTGGTSSATVEFPRDVSLLESFQVDEPCVFTYKFSMIKNALKAMSLGTKVALRVDNSGLLNMQFMIPSGEGSTRMNYVDFRVLSLEQDDTE